MFWDALIITLSAIGGAAVALLLLAYVIVVCINIFQEIARRD